MSKVFEALQRQQQDRQAQETGRDPLAATTGSPDAPPSQNDAGTTNADGDDIAADYELPTLIGAPSGPRSNEGMIFTVGPSAPSGLSGPSVSSSYQKVEEPPDLLSHPRGQNSSPAPLVNGKAERENRATGRPPAHPSASRMAHRSVAESVAAASALRRARIEETDARESAAPEEPAPLVSAPREIPVEHLSLKRLHPRLILLTEPHAAECEQYRTLRTQLFHAAEKKQMQVVIITSALAGEGKTSTVLNLALAIAQSKEKRVLIIDGDLRRPNIATYLGLQPKVGLAETLSGEAETLNTIFCLDGQELYVLPVSGESVKPTELLSSERFGEMIKLLRGYFDFILIDSPPVMPFADSRLLANHADGVILVIRAGMAPYETVEKAIDALPAGRILGVVLNNAEDEKETRYYDNYYSYSNRGGRGGREGRRQSFREKLAHRVRRSWVGRKMNL